MVKLKNEAMRLLSLLEPIYKAGSESTKLANEGEFFAFVETLTPELQRDVDNQLDAILDSNPGRALALTDYQDVWASFQENAEDAGLNWEVIKESPNSWILVAKTVFLGLSTQHLAYIKERGEWGSSQSISSTSVELLKSAMLELHEDDVERLALSWWTIGFDWSNFTFKTFYESVKMFCETQSPADPFLWVYYLDCFIENVVLDGQPYEEFMK